jgi:NAD(P)-dependent dehydrogenase (short-subunit alcohol dehydrogenase family)
MRDFEGKVVLVTGAGRGAGRAIAQAFAEQGAILAVNDITPINLDETVAGIREAGAQVKDYIFDIAKRLPARALVEEITGDWGRLDILINHANVRPRASILEMDEWDWQRTLDVNLSGAFYLMQSAGRTMREQGGGVIIHIGSSIEGLPGFNDRAAYLASMTGLLGLSRSAAREFEAYNIRVNMVCTGLAEGSFHPSLEQAESYAQVAGLALFLCSPAAEHIRGQVFNLEDGP